MTYTAQWIAEVLDATLHGEDCELTGGIHTDSRECGPGSVYVARIGENNDGHDYIEAAIDNGAKAIIVQRPYRGQRDVAWVATPDTTKALGKLARAHLKRLRAANELTVIGITGSVGKTTTKDLTAHILATNGPTVASEKSYNNEVGMPLTILRARPGTRYLVLEMGASGQGHLQYLARIAPPNIVVELAVGKAHLGGFGSVDALARAKAELVDGMAKGGTAILNRDDPHVASMVDLVKGGSVVFFSAKGAKDAHMRATHIRLDDKSCPHFDLEAGDVLKRVRLALVGRHQVSNALAAIAVAIRVGMKPSEVVEAINGVSAESPHRMRVVEREGITYIDDSYNANPDSMRAGLEVLGKLGERATRRIAVLGEMLELGQASASLHRGVGRRAADIDLSVLITVGDGARQIAEPLRGRTECHHCEDATEVADLLTGLLSEGDVVFLKGSNGSGVWKVADQLIGN